MHNKNNKLKLGLLLLLLLQAARKVLQPKRSSWHRLPIDVAFA